MPGVCLVCAYNVPGVCTYFFDKYILKYGIRAFQRCVARLSTTKTRCYESISILETLIRQLSRLVSRDGKLMCLVDADSSGVISSLMT